ncbi:gluconolaconase [bacterium]|nr:MAG: gluconolaconase [bacterium]
MIALIAAAALAPAQTVHEFYGPMVTGLTVSRTGRIFANFPRWGDRVTAAVVEIKNGKEVPYPNAVWNRLPDKRLGKDRFMCVQSVVVDSKDRLWVVDAAAPGLQDTLPGAPKLVCIDLRTNRIQRIYRFPETVVTGVSYLNDVRFDLTRGKLGYAFMTDSSAKGNNGIVVVDLASGQSWRRLNRHPTTLPEPGFIPVVEGQRLMIRRKVGNPSRVTVGADGIAINPRQDRLYYCPLISRHLYSVSISSLIDQSNSEDEVAGTIKDEGVKGASDGLIASANGTLYVTDYERNQVKRRNADGSYTPVIQLPRYEWPDTLSIGPDGWLYVTANQLQRQKNYRVKDMRKKPYRLVRTRVGAVAP